MSILDTRIYRWLETATDFFLLNLLWLVACLPVVTIFPSTAAMFGVVRDWVRGKEGSLTRTFITRFQENLGQSLLIGSDLDGVRGSSLPRLPGGQPALLLGRNRAEVATRARLHPVRFRFCVSVASDGPLRGRLEDGDKELSADIYREAANYAGVPGVPGSYGRAHRGRAFPGDHHGQHFSVRGLQAVRRGVQEDRRSPRRRVAKAGSPRE